MGVLYVLCGGMVGAVWAWYLVWYLFALVAGVWVSLRCDDYTVDSADPVSKENMNRFVRKVKPMELLVVGKGDKLVYPVLTGNQRITLQGLRDGSLRSDVPEDWEVVDVQGNNPMPSPIQHRWGFMSPLFVYRSMVYWWTGRHVVRVRFPGFFWGFYESHAPLTTQFIRARARKRNEEALANNRAGFYVVDQPSENADFQTVSDVSDHFLWQFELPILTFSFPTRNGFSIVAFVTLYLQVVDLHKLVQWRNWSELLRSTVSDAASVHIRAGELEEVYASRKRTENAGNDERVRELQGIVERYLKNTEGVRPFASRNGVQMSVLEVLGLELRSVMLNDLLPENLKTEEEIRRILSIELEGNKKAGAAGAMIKAQVDALSGVDADVRQHLAAITAAQNAGKNGGKLDYVMSTGGGSLDQALLLKLLRALEQQGGGTPSGGTPPPTSGGTT